MVKMTTSLLARPLIIDDNKKNAKKIRCPPPPPRREIQKAAYWNTPVISRLMHMYAFCWGIVVEKGNKRRKEI